MSTPTPNNYDHLFRYIIVGDMAVGKSCLLLQFTDNKFRHQHELTIGVEFGGKTIEVGNKVVKIQIWDTAGQEKFRSISHSYIRNADAIILVYDVTNEETFDHVSTWMEAIQGLARQGLPVILVGNKIDMENERKISTEEGQKLAEKYKILFKEASAMSGNGVTEAFTMLTIEIFDKQGISGNSGCKLEDAKKVSNNKRKCDC